MVRTAAVVGGGIGGLAVAIGLHCAGWRVTVFERASGLPSSGTGLGMWPAALKALDELGVGPRAREVGRRQPSGVIRRPDGTPIATIDVERLKRRQGEPVYLLSRPALLGLLAEALPPEAVQFDSPVSDVDGLRAAYDVVIGADGIGSSVRAALFGDAYAQRYAGATVWRGVADLDTQMGGETWGRGIKFGITPQEPGRTNWYAVLTVAEGYRSTDSDEAELRRHFGAWHDPIPAILERYAQSGVLRHGLYYLDPPLETYVQGPVALIGDAAHAMVPDLGQGGCQALIDAVVLAQCLAATHSVQDGLLQYDRRRRRPTQRIAAMALRANRLSHVRRFIGLRDAALKVALHFGPPS